jgi:hypothetical protein
LIGRGATLDTPHSLKRDIVSRSRQPSSSVPDKHICLVHPFLLEAICTTADDDDGYLGLILAYGSGRETTLEKLQHSRSIPHDLTFPLDIETSPVVSKIVVIALLEHLAEYPNLPVHCPGTSSLRDPGWE